MHLAGCQINPIDVNVHFHIVLIKIQLTIYDPKGTRSENLKYLPSCYDSKYSLFWTFRAYLENLLETLNKALSSRMEMTRQLAILCTTTYRADMPSVTASYVQAQGSCMYACSVLTPRQSNAQLIPRTRVFCLVLELAGHNSLF